MKSFITKITLSISTIIIMLVFLEIFFRVFQIHANYYQPRFDLVKQPSAIGERVPYGFTPFAIIRSQYSSNPRGYFDDGNIIDHHFNSLGWRDVEHAVKKPLSTYRILGLGDSYLYGQGVKAQDICHTKLGKLLQGSVQGFRIETINTGLSGMNTVDEYKLLSVRGLQFEPDLVIVYFVLNDVENQKGLYKDGYKVEFHTNYTSIYQSPDRMSNYSYFYGWIRQRYLQSIRARSYIKQCIDYFKEGNTEWIKTSAALEDIQKLCQKNNAGLLVVIFPFFIDLNDDYPFQAIHDTVKNFCSQKNIPVLDLLESYKSYSGPELWVHPTDQHPNEHAHDIAAQSIYKYLMGRPETFKLVSEKVGR